MPYITTRLTFDLRARTFGVLAALLCASLVMYIYAVTVTVHNTARRQALEGQVASITTSLSELEFNSIALKNKIDLDLALAHGFSEVTSPTYVARSAGPALTLR